MFQKKENLVLVQRDAEDAAGLGGISASMVQTYAGNVLERQPQNWDLKNIVEVN